MAFLIDGNNLMHALIGVAGMPGRGGLVRLLQRLVDRGEKVHVVFDGPPSEPGAPQIEFRGVRVSYSGRRTADEVLARLIATDSGPRELVVVSSDREVRRHARRRGCSVRSSEAFAKTLRAAARPARKDGGSAEPPEKTAGLPPGQTDDWLKEFGLR